MLDLSHKKLEVWKLSLVLVKEVYKLTATFPKEETFGLSSQMRRSVVSVASNLAEGAARKSPKEKARFFEVSRSSIVELDTQVEISKTLNYVSQETLQLFNQTSESIFKILSKLIQNAERGK